MARVTGMRGSYTDPSTGVSWQTGGGGGGGSESGYNANQAVADYNTISSGVGGSGGYDTVAPPPPRAATVGAADSSAAEAAAFARAKDRTGRMAGGAIASLRANLAGRNMAGSGNESRGVARVVNQNQGELGDVIRQQAIEAAQRAQAVADRNYQGDITQRGQDIQQQEAERQRQLAAKNQQSQAILSLMRGLRRAPVY